MSKWEGATGATDEWYTPQSIFDALETIFDMDVAGASQGRGHVPCRTRILLPRDGLQEPWSGFVWMNPPFGGRNGIVPWLDRFFAHGNGIALTPDRTSAPWWQDAAPKADAILFWRGKPKFERPDGSVGASPSHGITLFAVGAHGCLALHHAATRGFGFLCEVPKW